jgi:hypothetical protein
LGFFLNLRILLSIQMSQIANSTKGEKSGAQDTPWAKKNVPGILNLSGIFKTSESVSTLAEGSPVTARPPLGGLRGRPAEGARSVPPSGVLKGREVPLSLFSLNHLGYVVSSAATLHSYLQEALHIDGTFLNLFTFDDWIAALELTLHYRPPEVPTEHYLKSQNLWIMHKLLLRKGLREPIQALLHHLYEKRSKETAGLRAELGRILDAGKEGLSAVPPSSTAHVLGTLHAYLAQFQDYNQGILRSEAQNFTADRCRVIRGFSRVLCQQGGEAWLKRATLEELEKGCCAPL